MKIHQIILSETTTAGAVATVAKPMGETQKRTTIRGLEPIEKVMSGKAKKRGPYANSLVESRMKELEIDLKPGRDGLTAEEFKKKYGKTKEEMRKEMQKKPAPVKEAKLDEEDVIIVPGRGMKRKTGFVPHGKSRVDHEVEMARSDVLATMKNAKAIYELIKDRSEDDGIEGWVQEKLIKANDYLNAVKEYYDEKMMSNEMTGGVIAAGGVGEARVPQLPTRGADYSKYDTDHLEMLLRPGILHRNELGFKKLIRKELERRRQAQPVNPKDLVVPLSDVPVKKPRGHKQYDPSRDFPGVFKEQGVAEGSEDKVHLKTPKHGLADHPGRNTGVGLRTFAQTPEQDRCPKCNSLFKNHYKQGVAEGSDKNLNEMNPYLVQQGLEVVIDFLTKYPTATAVTAGAAGAIAGGAIIKKLVTKAWQNHKELEQLKQDILSWSYQKLHANKNVGRMGGKVAKIIQKEIERRKQNLPEQGVAEGSEQDDPYRGATPAQGKTAARNAHRLGITYTNPHSPKYHKTDYMAWDRDYNSEMARLKKKNVAEGSLNEEAGNMVVRQLITDFNKQMSGSPYYPLDYKDVGMRSWTRGDRSRYKDPGYIYIDKEMNPQDIEKYLAQKPIEKFWDFLSTKGAKKIGDVSGEFGSDPHSPAVVLGKLIFVYNGKNISWGSTSRLKNSSVWRQKQQQGVAEGGILKSIKRGLQGWDKNAIGPSGEKLGNPRDIVNRAKAMDTDTAKKVRSGLDAASDHSPAGLQKRVLDRKLKGVAEGWKEKVGAASLAGSMALGGQAYAGSIGNAVAQGLGAGKTSAAISSVADDSRNASDTEFAKQIPNEVDRAIYLKALKRIKHSRAMAYASPALIGANAALEIEFKKLQQSMAEKYNIQMPVKEQGVAEGAKVDRMVGHIKKSEIKTGKSPEEAENIAWATVNKRGYLDNKNKKKSK